MIKIGWKFGFNYNELFDTVETQIKIYKIDGKKSLENIYGCHFCLFPPGFRTKAHMGRWLRAVIKTGKDIWALGWAFNLIIGAFVLNLKALRFSISSCDHL